MEEPESYHTDPYIYYQNLLAAIRESDIRRVAEIMLKHVGEGNSINISQIAVQTFGHYNTTTERQTRSALETLVRQYRMPIGAYSGKNGRWLCASEDERQRAIADLEKRVSSTNERIRSLRHAVIPANEPQFEKPAQQSLWGW